MTDSRMKSIIFSLLLLAALPLMAQKSESLALSGHFKSTDSAAVVSEKLPLVKKSVGTALLLSLVLPGSGQYYMGESKSAALFLSSEALLWLGLFTNNAYHDQLVADYQSYAVQHAQVNPQGKSKQYWTDIGKYDDIYLFNEQRARQRYFENMYEENRENYWFWDVHQNRIRYDASRLHANEIAARVVYFQAAVVLNHLASGLHAMYLARVHNRKLKEAHAWNLSFQSSSFVSADRYIKARISIGF